MVHGLPDLPCLPWKLWRDSRRVHRSRFYFFLPGQKSRSGV